MKVMGLGKKTAGSKRSRPTQQTLGAEARRLEETRVLTARCHGDREAGEGL